MENPTSPVPGEVASLTANVGAKAAWGALLVMGLFSRSALTGR
jgi:hypothetical protein